MHERSENTTGEGGPRLSARIRDLRASPIREILSVINRPGMISFAGGLPAPDSFPRFGLQDMATARAKGNGRCASVWRPILAPVAYAATRSRS